MSPALPLVIGLAAAACTTPLPEPPDLAPLIAVYERPDAVIDDTSGAELGGAIALATELRDVLSGGEPLEETIAAPFEEASGPDAGPEDEEGDPPPFGLRGDGVARVRHVCAGWPEHAERVAEITGLLEATVRFSEKGLDAVIWGTAERCALTIEDRRLLFEGELALAYADGFLFTIDTALEIDGERRFATGFDFRASGRGFEFRQEMTDGTQLVVLLDSDGPLLRAANGDFRCALGVCTRGDGLEITLPDPTAWAP